MRQRKRSNCSASVARRSTHTSAGATSARNRLRPVLAAAVIRATTSSGLPPAPGSGVIRRRLPSRRCTGECRARSAITLIAGERLYYRGHDATVLAGRSSVAELAALLWTGTADGATLVAPSRKLVATQRLKPAVPFVAAAQAALALAGAHDPLAYDLRPHAVAQTGWRIAWRLAGVAAGIDQPCDTIDATLANGWGVPRAADLLRTALILCADHELNVSTAARCVASAGSSPYNVVIAGLAALEGTKHGGTTARIEASWNHCAVPGISPQHSRNAYAATSRSMASAIPSIRTVIRGPEYCWRCCHAAGRRHLRAGSPRQRTRPWARHRPWISHWWR